MKTIINLTIYVIIFSFVTVYSQNLEYVKSGKININYTHGSSNFRSINLSFASEIKNFIDMHAGFTYIFQQLKLTNTQSDDGIHFSSFPGLVIKSTVFFPKSFSPFVGVGVHFNLALSDLIDDFKNNQEAKMYNIWFSLSHEVGVVWRIIDKFSVRIAGKYYLPITHKYFFRIKGISFEFNYFLGQ